MQRPCKKAVKAFRRRNLLVWCACSDLVLTRFERVRRASPIYSIILSGDVSLMDGIHRLGKAILEGCTELEAGQFPVVPVSDEVGDSYDK